MEKHETVHVPVKFAEVDKGILPVVKWLNDYDQVCTFHSCEGSAGSKPYVSFIIEFDFGNTLNHILTMVEDYARVEVSYHIGTRRYCIRFDSGKDLKNFIDFIEDTDDEED